jgi:hypothetical protein
MIESRMHHVIKSSPRPKQDTAPLNVTPHSIAVSNSDNEHMANGSRILPHQADIENVSWRSQ